MSQITALKAGRDQKKRINIFLDGKFAFSLNTETAAKEGLQVKQVLSTEQIEALLKAEQFYRCLDVALHYLSYRPRSEFELRTKLRQHGFDPEIQETTITKLKEKMVVDDVAFAQFWKDNRELFRPRSRQLTKLELKRKGIANDIIDQVIETVDEEDNAYRAALSKARRLPQLDYWSFRRRIGEYLKRRGFNYEVINHTVERLWLSQENHSSESSIIT